MHYEIHKGPQKEPWGDTLVPLATKKLAGDATSLDYDAAWWPGKEQGALQDNVAHKDRSGGLLNPKPLSTGAFQPSLGFPLSPQAYKPRRPPNGSTGAKARYIAAHAPTARGAPRLTRMRTLAAAGTAHRRPRPRHVPPPSGRSSG